MIRDFPTRSRSLDTSGYEARSHKEVRHQFSHNLQAHNDVWRRTRRDAQPRCTRLVQDSGHRVAAELSPVMTHAASHRQTSGHLHVGKAGSEHSMFSCFVVSFQHTFFQETLIYCFHPSFVFLRPPNMSEHVADMRVVRG